MISSSFYFVCRRKFPTEELIGKIPAERMPSWPPNMETSRLHPICYWKSSFCSLKQVCYTGRAYGRIFPAICRKWLTSLIWEGVIHDESWIKTLQNFKIFISHMPRNKWLSRIILAGLISYHILADVKHSWEPLFPSSCPIS